MLNELLLNPVYKTARDLENAIETAPLAKTPKFDKSLLPTQIWGDGKEDMKKIEDHKTVSVQLMGEPFVKSALKEN